MNQAALVGMELEEVIGNPVSRINTGFTSYGF